MEVDVLEECPVAGADEVAVVFLRSASVVSLAVEQYQMPDPIKIIDAGRKKNVLLRCIAFPRLEDRRFGATLRINKRKGLALDDRLAGAVRKLSIGIWKFSGQRGAVHSGFFWRLVGKPRIGVALKVRAGPFRLSWQ